MASSAPDLRRRWWAAAALACCVPATALAAPGDAARPGAPGATRSVPAVAAASDLKFALAQIADLFEKDTGQRVVLAFGSSGNFARQIPQGAPYELFFSADEQYVEALARAGLTRDAGVVYAVGRLALLVPAGSAIRLDPALKGLREALPTIRRFAIANPEHAPYGRAAREALQALGLWDALLPRLVYAENIAQAAQFVATGAAEAGLVAYALVAGEPGSALGRHVLLPQSLHGPLRQRMVLLRGAGPVAIAFHDYVQQPASRAVLRRFGFAVGD